MKNEKNTTVNPETSAPVTPVSPVTPVTPEPAPKTRKPRKAKKAVKVVKPEGAAPAKRGRKPAKVKYPQGAFTVQQLFALNDKSKGGSVKCMLTARNHIMRGLKSGLFVQMDKNVKSNKVGAPAHRFMLKSRFDAGIRNLAVAKARREGVTTAVVVGPVNTVEAVQPF